MPDRIEREIEEILARLDDLPAEPGRRGKTPVPLASRKKAPAPAEPRSSRASGLLARVSPATMMISGAAVMLAGLVLSSFADPFIWLSFAGVVLFIGAFAISFFRKPAPSASPARGVYWRDRYIEYEPGRPGLSSRIRRLFRRG
jgi:hypothetical protein